MRKQNKQFKTDSVETPIKHDIENFTIKIDASSIERLPHGIRYPISITRTGILNYIYNGKIIKEYRSPEEVFHQDSISTLRGAPVTDEHPPDRKITSENYHKYVKGAISDILTVNGDKLDGFMTVYDEPLNTKILSGQQQEISPGYGTVDLEEPGQDNGEPYDVKQTKIRYNHVAVVKRGRSGRSVRVKTDDGLHLDSSQEEKENINESQKEKMTTMKLNGKEFKCDDVGEVLIEQKFKEDSEKITSLQLTVQDYKDKERDLQEKVTKLDTAEALNAKLEKDIETMKTKNDEDVANRVNTAIKAKNYLKNDADIEGLEPIEIKKMVISQAFPNKDYSAKNDSFFDVLFETLDDMPEQPKQSVKKDGRDLFNKPNFQSQTVKNDNYENLLSSYKKRSEVKA